MSLEKAFDLVRKVYIFSPKQRLESRKEMLDSSSLCYGSASIETVINESIKWVWIKHAHLEDVWVHTEIFWMQIFFSGETES